MKPVEGILNFRTVIARCALDGSVGTVACATTTTPVSRQADPAFARKVVTYSSPVPGTIVIDPANHFLYLVQSGGQAIRYWGRRRRRRLWVVGQG
jgi:lipoprotein-anchoring transpeptidase ErfK/SrfK